MKSICRFAIIFVALYHVLTIFIPVKVPLLLFLLTALLFCSGICLQERGFRKITLFFLLAGSGILGYYRLAPEVWMESFVSMTNVISIIVVMQFFTLPIELGGYAGSVEYWLRKSFKKESSLYLFAMLVTHAFSSFLLFGTVPVMVSLFSKALKNNIANYKRFLATAIVRGYALVLFWAPGAIIMLLVLQVTQVSWFDLVVPGFLLSLIGLATAYGLEHVTRLNKIIPAAAGRPEDRPEAKSLARTQAVHILLVVVGLLLLVALFDAFSIGFGTGKILLSGLIIAGLWLFYYRRHAEMGSTLKQYWRDGVMKAADLSVFFISMGLFAGAVDKSGILMQIQPILQQGVNQLGSFSIIAVPLLFIFLAMAGIHPLILAVIFGKVLTGLSLPLPLVSIALLLVLASAVSFVVSPFAGMVLMTAKFLEVKPMEVAVKWNAGFCALFLAEGILFACFWH
ncbi:MAG: hypothetical protein ABFC57_02055 [Veillonellales bacterium]